MVYKVINRFKELKHDGHVYEKGDVYPKEGQKATKSRLEQLSTTDNKCNKVFIEAVNKTPSETE